MMSFSTSGPTRFAPRALALALAVVLSGCGGSSEPAPAPAPSGSSSGSSAAPSAAEGLAAGVYTAAQAEAGQEVYRTVCSDCHDLRELRGSEFMYNWEGTSVGRLYRSISETMPEDDPGSLDSEQYLAVVAYILELNEFPAGDTELGSDMGALNQLRIQH
jgi:mono/diheme cytochrome c family protein